jgi:hypothetical protein
MTLSLTDMASRAHLSTKADAEKYVLHMVSYFLHPGGFVEVIMCEI